MDMGVGRDAGSGLLAGPCRATTFHRVWETLAGTPLQTRWMEKDCYYCDDCQYYIIIITALLLLFILRGHGIPRKQLWGPTFHIRRPDE